MLSGACSRRVRHTSAACGPGADAQTIGEDIAEPEVDEPVLQRIFRCGQVCCVLVCVGICPQVLNLTFGAWLLEDDLILKKYQNTDHFVDLILTVGTGEISSGTTNNVI